MRNTRVGSVNKRFNDRYDIDEHTCWNWTGSINSKGYGIISGEINGKRYAKVGQNLLAHRVSWIIHNGDIPEDVTGSSHGTVVMHKCDNPRCVNPKHLMLGTQADNVKDMVKKGRKVSGTPSGVKHWNSAFKNQADIDLICATKGKTKELAEKYGVDVCTIKRIRVRNGIITENPEKYVNKKITKEAIEHIRSTPAGTRGLGKFYGVSKTTISKIRKGLSHND